MATSHEGVLLLLRVALELKAQIECDGHHILGVYTKYTMFTVYPSSTNPL